MQWTRLRALAQEGRGADAVLNLTHLDTRDSARVDACRIARLVLDACHASDWDGALALLQHGRQRHPERSEAWDELACSSNLRYQLDIRPDFANLRFTHCTF